MGGKFNVVCVAFEDLVFVAKGRDRHFPLDGEGLKAQRKVLWMNSLCGFLHARLQILFCGLLEFASCPSPRGRPNTNSGRPCLESRAVDDW